MFGMGTGVTPLPEAPALKREFVICNLEVLVYHISITYERVSSGFNLVLSQVARPISTGKLHMLPCFHVRPIKQVIFLWPLGT